MWPGLLLALVLNQNAPSLATGRARLEQLRHGALGPSFRNKASAILSYGNETRVVSESLEALEGTWKYTRVIGVTGYARGVVIELTLDARGGLLDASSRFPTEAAPTIYGAYRTKTSLRLPLDGTWDVLWGGRSWEDNHHASMSEMRFALDLWKRENGTTFRNKGLRNEEYFAWNQPVVAPADGVVVSMREGVSDNVPQRAVPGNVYGNHLVIDHGNGEFTLLGHLRKGSLRVRVGQHVSEGQVLANVGNSGMSTEPHLHFHVMDGVKLESAQGLPLQLVDLELNGHSLDRGEPRRGDQVRSLSPEARR